MFDLYVPVLNTTLRRLFPGLASRQINPQAQAHVYQFLHKGVASLTQNFQEYMGRGATKKGFDTSAPEPDITRF